MKDGNDTLSTRLSPFQKVYLLLVAGFIVGPFLPVIIQSLAFRWAWPELLPGTWWLEQRERSTLPLSWDYVLSPYSRVWEATVNTVFIGLVVTVICLAICLPVARLLARESFAGKSAFEFFLSLPLIVPEAAIGIALLMIFIRMGLAGSYAGIIIAHLIPTIPYMVRMLAAVYQGLGRDFEEQAMILGARPLQILWRVTLPMLLPGVVAGALFTFLVSTNIFLL
ncbi:MAG: ABC transporter permease subunit, partial [Boseongicola sp. SB0667_bin_21]|nr:ABC transporter permease subunit [Boseongicola sp. SB0667_bin_21]